MDPTTQLYIALAVVGGTVVVVSAEDAWTTKRARAAATRRGYEFEASPAWSEPAGSLLLDPHRGKVAHRCSRAGSPDVGLLYSYGVGGRARIMLTVAVVELPLNAPHMIVLHDRYVLPGPPLRKVRPDLGAVAAALQPFDGARVLCDDPDFAATLLSDEFVVWMRTAPPGPPTSFELLGPHLVCVRKQRSTDATLDLLEWASGARAAIPGDVQRRYPKR